MKDSRRDKVTCDLGNVTRINSELSTAFLPRVIGIHGPV